MADMADMTDMDMAAVALWGCPCQGGPPGLVLISNLANQPVAVCRRPRPVVVLGSLVRGSGGSGLSMGHSLCGMAVCSCRRRHDIAARRLTCPGTPPPPYTSRG